MTGYDTYKTPLDSRYSSMSLCTFSRIVGYIGLAIPPLSAYI